MAVRSVLLATALCLAGALPAQATTPDLSGHYVLQITGFAPPTPGAVGATDCLVLTQNKSVLNQPVSGVADFGMGNTGSYVKIGTIVNIPLSGATYTLSLRNGAITSQGEAVGYDTSGKINAIFTFRIALGNC